MPSIETLVKGPEKQALKCLLMTVLFHHKNFDIKSIIFSPKSRCYLTRSTVNEARATEYKAFPLRRCAQFLKRRALYCISSVCFPIYTPS